MTQQYPDGPWTTGLPPADPNSGAAGIPAGPARAHDTGPIRTPPPYPGQSRPGPAAGPAPGSQRQAWSAPPPPPVAPAAPSGPVSWSGRLAAAAAGTALVLVGASVGITLALDHPGSDASTTAGATGPHGTAPTAGTPQQVGQPSATALVSGYLKAENNGQGDSLSRYLCGGTGPAADSATEWSWTFIALNEQLAASPLTPATGGQQVTITVSYRGQPSGQYGALLAQRGTRWCVQAIANGPLPGGGQ